MSVSRRRRSSIAQVLWHKTTHPKQGIWDVGSVRTKVLVAGKIVLDEPTVVAVRTDTGQVIHYGNQAYSLVGASNDSIKAIFPISRGGIAHAPLAIEWIQFIARQLWPRRRWLPFSFSPGGHFIVPSGIGVADSLLWATVFEQAGLHFMKPKPAGTAMPLFVNVPSSELLWVLDLGGDHSSIQLITEGDVIQATQIGWGGIPLSSALQHWLAQNHSCSVSWKEAERIKKEFGSFTFSSHKKCVIRGKNPSTQLGTTITLAQEEMQTFLVGYGQQLVLHIKQFLAGLHAAQATACLENGLWLMGGSALLDGIDSWLATHLRCSVTIVRQPQDALIQSVYLQQSALLGQV